MAKEFLEGIQIEGFELLETKLLEAAKKLEPETVEPILLYRGATPIADKIRSLAPVGPTGNLRAGVVAKKLKRIGDHPAPSIAAINYARAPHAHLLEYGTSKMRARPFFRPGYESTIDSATESVLSEIAKEIEDGFNT